MQPSPLHSDMTFSRQLSPARLLGPLIAACSYILCNILTVSSNKVTRAYKVPLLGCNVQKDRPWFLNRYWAPSSGETTLFQQQRYFVGILLLYMKLGSIFNRAVNIFLNKQIISL